MQKRFEIISITIIFCLIILFGCKSNIENDQKPWPKCELDKEYIQMPDYNGSDKLHCICTDGYEYETLNHTIEPCLQDSEKRCGKSVITCVKPVRNFTLFPISQIKQNNNSGRFNTEGYVVFKHIEPPCPKDLLCEHDPDAVIISETNYLKESRSNILETEFYANMFSHGRAKDMEIGKKYLLSIEFEAKYGYFRVLGFEKIT